MGEHTARHFFDRTLRQPPELKRPITGSDEASHLQSELFEQFLDFAVFAFAERHGQPAIAALAAVERGLGRAIADPVNGEAVGKFGYSRFIDIAMSSD